MPMPPAAPSGEDPGVPGLSIIVPVFNEAENLPRLHDSIVSGIADLGYRYEILYVDDGSRDDSPAILRRLVEGHPEARVVLLKRNFGQTAAMTAGIDHSKGAVLVTLDADMQNDPLDIRHLLEKLDEGYDVVSGWRRHRQDAQFTRTLPSRAANWLIGHVTGLPLHDFGCTLKAYRRDVFQEVRLYGEMHRFIPAYAHWAGARVAEIEVRHHPRTAGESKYGLSRTVKVVLDLLTMTFLQSFSTKPLYVFGGLGGLCLALATSTAVYICARRLFWHGEWMSPLILVTAVLVVGGLQFILLGLLAELLVRTYHESQGKPTYAVREIVAHVPRGVDAR